MEFKDYISLGNKILEQIEAKRSFYPSNLVDDFKKQYLINLEQVSKTNIVPEFKYAVTNMTEATLLQNNFEIVVEESVYLPQDYVTENHIRKVSSVIDSFVSIYSQKSKGKIAVIPSSKESFDFIMGINRLMFNTPAIPMFRASVFNTKNSSYPTGVKATPKHQANTSSTPGTQAPKTLLMGWDSLD